MQSGRHAWDAPRRGGSFVEIGGSSMHWMSRITAIAALICLFGGPSTIASAQRGRVQFVYRGGNWSHNRHAGWHRYWGGPSIGFYYAPQPVYVVRGYDEPYYYEGPDYWYSDPAFGFSLSVGNGGWYDRDHRFHRYSNRSFEHDRRFEHRSYRDRDRDDHRRDRDRDRWRDRDRDDHSH